MLQALKSLKAYDKKTLAQSFASGVVQIILAAVLCYDNIKSVFFFVPWLFIRMRQGQRRYERNRDLELEDQFADGIICIGAALEAGYSIENAVTEAIRDLKITYSDDAEIIQVFEGIRAKLDAGISIEDAFGTFAKSTGRSSIKSFSDIFSISKRTGGNVLAIIRATSGNIKLRREMNREHQAAIAAQRYETQIMRIMPVGIIIYLRMFSGEMMAGLYGNSFGVMFMTGILIGYIGFWILGEMLIGKNL